MDTGRGFRRAFWVVNGEVDAGNLKELAEKIRRQPKIAESMDVSLLIQDLSGRWREAFNMITVSEEVPVAAWIVLKKVEGLVRPAEEMAEEPGFDAELRPAWLDEAVTYLVAIGSEADKYWGHAGAAPYPSGPIPVKEPNVWKLAWSYPRLRKKPEVPVATVGRLEFPLKALIAKLWRRLAQRPEVVLNEELSGQSRGTWAVTFLAVVHLWHQGAVDLEQGGAYAPLVIRKIEGRKGYGEA